MNKVFALPPGEDWIVDRLVSEWNSDNTDITVSTPEEADVIWLMADWCWRHVAIDLLSSKKVVVTVHHIVPEKFGPAARLDFETRDRFTDAYIVPNKYTYDFVRGLTMKPVYMIPYWANQHIFKKTDEQHILQTKYAVGGVVIGSFQRDTEGHDLKSPKLEKGPDLLADALIKEGNKSYNLGIPFFVVLAGWRRQYIMKRLDEAKIDYKYFERPDHATLNELYQTLDEYWITARHEGGPQALIECGLHEIPVRSRPVGMADQLLDSHAIHDDICKTWASVPDVEHLELPHGYGPYRELFEEL